MFQTIVANVTVQDGSIAVEGGSLDDVGSLGGINDTVSVQSSGAVLFSGTYPNGGIASHTITDIPPWVRAIFIGGGGADATITVTGANSQLTYVKSLPFGSDFP